LFGSSTNRVAVAQFATKTAGNLPVIFLAHVTAFANHVRQARTLSSAPVALTDRLVCAEDVADAL
jgi:hypothetical protein